MGMFKNVQHISKITFSPKYPCYNKCPLGQEYLTRIGRPGDAGYRNNFTITFKPKEVVCDYCDVEDWIDLNLSQKVLTIEDAVDKLFNYIQETYSPEYLKVSSYVDDAVHGPVTVEKEI